MIHSHQKLPGVSPGPLTSDEGILETFSRDNRPYLQYSPYPSLHAVSEN